MRFPFEYSDEEPPLSASELAALTCSFVGETLVELLYVPGGVCLRSTRGALCLAPSEMVGWRGGLVDGEKLARWLAQTSNENRFVLGEKPRQIARMWTVEAVFLNWPGEFCLVQLDAELADGASFSVTTVAGPGDRDIMQPRLDPTLPLDDARPGMRTRWVDVVTGYSLTKRPAESAYGERAATGGDGR